MEPEETALAHVERAENGGRQSETWQKRERGRGRDECACGCCWRNAQLQAHVWTSVELGMRVPCTHTHTSER
eukprot:6182901-Pleurochrysis_carterae.AAC.2